MSDRLRRILQISALIGATGLFAVALYTMFFRQSTDIVLTPDTEDTGGTGTTGGLPQANTGGSRGSDTSSDTDGDSGQLPPSRTADGRETFTTLLTTSAVTAATPTSDGQVAYYDPGDGRFYTIDDEGNAEMLARQQFPNAESVVFSAGAEKAVIEFPDGTNVVFDFATAQQVTLPSHWEDFDFSPDTSSIVGKSLGTSSRSLVITQADGSSTRVVANLGNNESKVDVSWSPNANVLGFSRTGSVQDAFGRQQIYLIGTDGQDAGALIVDGTDFMNIWAPSGDYLLYSVANPNDEYRAALYYADVDGTLRKLLGIQTLASKCTFASEDTAYCAVPREMAPGGGSSIDALTSPDDLYKVSLPSGKATLAAIPAADTQMFNPSISSDGTTLYYSDSRGRLNAIQLR